MLLGSLSFWANSARDPVFLSQSIDIDESSDGSKMTQDFGSIRQSPTPARTRTARRVSSVMMTTPGVASNTSKLVRTPVQGHVINLLGSHRRRHDSAVVTEAAHAMKRSDSFERHPTSRRLPSKRLLLRPRLHVERAGHDAVRLHPDALGSARDFGEERLLVARQLRGDASALEAQPTRSNFSDVSRILTCLSRAMDARHSASAARARARCNAATSRRSSRSAPRMASADACSSSIEAASAPRWTHPSGIAAFPRRVEAHLDANSDSLAVGRLRLRVPLLSAPRHAVRPALLLRDASLLANEGVGVSLQRRARSEGRARFFVSPAQPPPPRTTLSRPPPRLRTRLDARPPFVMTVTDRYSALASTTASGERRRRGS